MNLKSFLTAVVLVSIPLAARAATVTVSGTVFADNDGDRVFSAGDEPLAGVVVAFETSAFAVTDENGHYSLEVDGSGVVWTRTPDGFVPTPTWWLVDGTGDVTTADMPLTPSHTSGPAVFVAGADSHLSVASPDEISAALAQAGSMVPEAHFMTIVGDLVDLTQAEEYMEFKQSLSTLDIPFVPVPGNHDWYDGGPNYRAYMGPPMYSFDDGGAHFIVLNFNSDFSDQVAFIQKDLTYPHAPVVAAFLHMPPTEAEATQIADAGVQFLFTGHVHSNHVYRRTGMIEWNTEPLVFGGLDFTPGGYRVVSLVDDAFRTTHHVTVDRPVMTLTFPRPGSCVDAGDVLMAAAVEMGPSTTTVNVSIDGAAPVGLATEGGWAYAGHVTLGEGDHDVVLSAQSGTLSLVEHDKVCARPPVTLPAATGDWFQLGSSAAHLGATDVEIAPPLRNLWSRPVGGYLFGGSPIVAGGTIYVSVVDLSDGDNGGVLAFDLVSGEELWEDRGNAVRNAPAYADGKIVYGSADGVIHAVLATTGETVWELDLGKDQDQLLSWVYAAPVIDSGIVLVGGQRTIVAADLETGVVLWSFMPDETIWATTLSTMALGGGVGVGVVGRGGQGVRAWDANDGTLLWDLGQPVSSAMMAAPVIDGDHVYLTNIDADVYSVDLATGTNLWTHTLYGATGDFRWGIVGTPAVADGRIFVPTPKDKFFTLDANTGQTIWTIDAGGTMIHALTYGTGGEKSFLASPVVTGDVVWIGGMDGVLRAVDTATGHIRWTMDLGAPIMSGIVPSPPYVVVGTFDGLLHVLVADDGSHEETPPEGCSCAVGVPRHPPCGLPFLLGLAVAVGARVCRLPRTQ